VDNNGSSPCFDIEEESVAGAVYVPKEFHDGEEEEVGHGQEHPPPEQPCGEESRQEPEKRERVLEIEALVTVVEDPQQMVDLDGGEELPRFFGISIPPRFIGLLGTEEVVHVTGKDKVPFVAFCGQPLSKWSAPVDPQALRLVIQEQAVSARNRHLRASLMAYGFHAHLFAWEEVRGGDHLHGALAVPLLLAVYKDPVVVLKIGKGPGIEDLPLPRQHAVVREPLPHEFLKVQVLLILHRYDDSPLQVMEALPDGVLR